MSPEERRQLIITIGTELYGERFGAPLARGLGVDQSLIVRIVKKERTATDLLLHQLANLLAREWQQRHAQLHRIESFVQQVAGHSLEEHLNLMAQATTPEDQGEQE